jgi:hypothetical protein
MAHLCRPGQHPGSEQRHLRITRRIGSTNATHLSYAAAAVMFLVFGLGFLLSFLLPEPQKDELPE